MLISPRVSNETVKALKALGAGYDRVGMFVGANEAAFCRSPDFAADAMRLIEEADGIIIVGAQPTRDNGVIAAKIRRSVRKLGAKLLIFHARKTDLDAYADVSAGEVSLERSFWKRVADALKGVRHPVLVYGPAAMTPIGITVLERLIGVFEKKRSGDAPRLLPLPITTNSLALSKAGVEPLEDVAGWLDMQPLDFLHIVASDEPDGGARLLDEKHVRRLLEEIDYLVVQASYESPLSELANVVLPAVVWSEKSGTITNFEGREMPLRTVLPARGEAREDHTILEALSA